MARIVRAKTRPDPDSDRPAPKVNQLLWDVAKVFGIDYGDARTRARYLRAEGLFPYARKTDYVTAGDAANLVMAFAGARTQDQSASAVHRYSALIDKHTGQSFGDRLTSWVNYSGIPLEDDGVAQIQFYWDLPCVTVDFGDLEGRKPARLQVFGDLDIPQFFLSATIQKGALMAIAEAAGEALF